MGAVRLKVKCGVLQRIEIYSLLNARGSFYFEGEETMVSALSLGNSFQA